MQKIIITLLIILYLLTLKPAPIKKINNTRVGEYVRVKGRAQEHLSLERITIINLTDDSGSIKTVFFNKIPGKKGQELEITGRVSEYKGEKELKGVKLKQIR